MWRVPVLLWAAAVVPSLFIVDKVGGPASAAAFMLVAFVASRFLPTLPLPSSRGRLLLRVATVAVLVLLFLMVYPAVNVHTPGAGSDDDDAYELGARALLRGTYPYDETTYLGNVLHQFAGSFLLAMPFVLLGSSAWQNLFWLALFAWTLGRDGRDEDGDDLRFGWFLLSTPVVLHQVLTGTGHFTNAVSVLLGLRWLIKGRHPLLASAAWGVTLASRANFLLLIPIAIGSLARQRGGKVAVACGAVIAATVLVLVVPFYLHAPAQFGPLEAADRLTRVDGWLPNGSLLLGVAMVALAVVLGVVPLGPRGVMMGCAAVQLLPIAGVVAIEWLAAGWLDLAFAAYAVFALPFVVAAVALRQSDDTMPSPALRVSKGAQVLAG